MESNQSIQAEEIRSKFPPDWEVPEFRIEYWDGKTSNYCVVVPVINEGGRIREFVQHLKECRIDSIADIIIVDGGSTDGSLDQAYLRAHSVRGLLTKIGPGKLSSQLRVAYAFSLLSSYDGIVTIDGNNKDDPQAIHDFISLARKGYDFIQASRFIEGGRHQNTPLLRYLAIRLIHAPLLSICSGFYWTDTTQGFRSYSRSSLQDPRVKPFRRVFKDYELLAYLSYRLPKIGLKCIETPASRLYPKGKVPTKISSFRGNLDLIKTLFLACFGKFNP
jgi:glycosyltransferase involved in cell wall biosynthesis